MLAMFHPALLEVSQASSKHWSYIGYVFSRELGSHWVAPNVAPIHAQTLSSELSGALHPGYWPLLRYTLKPKWFLHSN